MLGTKNVFKSLANLGWSSAILGKSAQIFSNLQKVIVGGVPKCLGDIRWSLEWFERSLEELGNASGDLRLPSKYPKLQSVVMSVIALSSDIFVLICTCFKFSLLVLTLLHCLFFSQSESSNVYYYMARSVSGQMNQILRCHWLLERARLSYLAR